MRGRVRQQGPSTCLGEPADDSIDLAVGEAALMAARRPPLGLAVHTRTPAAGPRAPTHGNAAWRLPRFALTLVPAAAPVRRQARRCRNSSLCVTVSLTPLRDVDRVRKRRAVGEIDHAISARGERHFFLFVHSDSANAVSANSAACGRLSVRGGRLFDSGRRTAPLRPRRSAYGTSKSCERRRARA